MDYQYSGGSTITLVMIAISTSSAGELIPGLEALLLSGTVVGSCVGIPQALILKRQMPRLNVWRWVLASTLGGYIGMMAWGSVMALLFATTPASGSVHIIITALLSVTLLGGMLGGSIGFGQTLILRPLLASPQRKCGLRRWWWANVAGRSLGWLSAMLVGLLLIISPWVNPLNIDQRPPFLGLLLCSSIGDLVYGGITATALPHLTP